VHVPLEVGHRGGGPPERQPGPGLPLDRPTRTRPIGR
jgi:hypothetical protein